MAALSVDITLILPTELVRLLLAPLTTKLVLGDESPIPTLPSALNVTVSVVPVLVVLVLPVVLG